jgi:hypothetical protein
MNIIVIHEKDFSDDEQIVIGVCDSVKKAEVLIKEYYGKFEELTYRDVRDSKIEYSKTLQVIDHKGDTYVVYITLEWFKLNEV